MLYIAYKLKKKLKRLSTSISHTSRLCSLDSDGLPIVALCLYAITKQWSTVGSPHKSQRVRTGGYYEYHPVAY